jgi:hypothetical protein
MSAVVQKRTNGASRRGLFEAVQSKLDQQRTNHAKARQKSQSLLMGRIFDDRGNRMTPSYAVKNAVRYR